MLGDKRLTVEEAKKLLSEKGQEHVLRGVDALSAGQRVRLLHQIAAIDWDMIALVGKQKDTFLGELTPPNTVEIAEIEKNRQEFKAAGLAMIRAGRVGAVLLAGGMGTRLGFDRPKGLFNIGLKRNLYVFELLIRDLLHVTDDAHAYVPLYIMTSERTHDETVEFLRVHQFFGYPEDQIFFFQQETNVCTDLKGKLLLEEPGKLASSPNGNGGWFASMEKAGLLSDLKNRRISWLNVFAVDNVLQRVADPVFIGATVDSGCDSGSKVVRKNSADEKVGVLCRVDGRPAVVEYYEMDEITQREKDKDGHLRFRYGVILNYLFRVDKLMMILDEHFPVHLAKKKIPYANAAGEMVEPDAPNGYKFETLAADMVGMMDDTLAFEVIRNREFAPIKNLHGVDSVDTARTLLQENGVLL